MNGLSSNNMSGNGSANPAGSTAPAPFLLTPVGKDYIWGGTRLKTDFQLGLDDVEPLAEAWVCSTHPDGGSRVNSSVLATDTANTANTVQLDLKTVLATHPEYLGTHAASIVNNANLSLGELPILVKLIDARSDLSVQVHPTDDYAAAYEPGQLGKTEMWYVIDADPDASLVYGLTREVTIAQFRDAIESGETGRGEAGKLEKFLNRVPVKRGDVFFIRAGIIHAIGAGCLIAEVQESSNLTYRLYDYNRVDPKSGKKRELHVEKGLAVAELGVCPVRQPMRTLKYRPGMATELLARCRYFQVERMLINTQVQAQGMKPRQTRQTRQPNLDAELAVGENSFHVLLCINGKGILVNNNCNCNNINNNNNYEAASYTHSTNEYLPFAKGSCIFIPAAGKDTCCVYNIIGQAELLNISC